MKSKSFITKGKTVADIIRETSLIMESKVILKTGGLQLFILRKYKDFTKVLIDKKGSYFLADMFHVYGTFKQESEVIEFKKILSYNLSAHQQAMWKSWEKDAWFESSRRL